MKLFPIQGLFPWFPLITGAGGLILQHRLLSAANTQGLLPKSPVFAGLILLFFLLTLVFCVLNLRKAALSKAYRHLFPPSALAAAGAVIGAAGISFCAFTSEATGYLRFLLPVAGVLSTAALLYAAYCRLKGLRPPCLLHGCLVVFLMLRLLVRCRVWGAEPQLLVFFFPFLSSVFLLLACFFRAEADALVGDYRMYLFFAQLALFCCCLSLPDKDWLFYLTCGIWMATDFCVIPAAKH